MNLHQPLNPNFKAKLPSSPPALHELVPHDVAEVFNKQMSVVDLTRSMGQQVVEGLKKVWAHVHGKEPDTADHWLFKTRRWQTVLTSSRTKFIQENMINRRVEKVYREAVCLKNKPDCPNTCPTEDYGVCPGCQEA